MDLYHQKGRRTSAAPANIAENGNHGGLTNEMMTTVQHPSSLHLRITTNVIESTLITFSGTQGFINGKDFQIQSLFEYEKLRTKGLRGRRRIAGA